MSSSQLASSSSMMQTPLYGATKNDADETKNADATESRSVTFPLVDFESKQVALVVLTYMQCDTGHIFLRMFLQFCDNGIITSKYTWWSFVPKSLFEQFRRIANFYFLVLSIIQMIGYHTTLYESAFTGNATLGTLALVIFFTMIIQLKDDISRHYQDNKINSRLCNVFREGKRKKIHSKDIKVGDLVLVEEDGEIPSDLMLLKTSDASGKCYVETKNIDGETNLKVRNSKKEICEACPIGSMEEISTLSGLCCLWHLREHERACLRPLGSVTCEVPNKDIHRFNGHFEVKKNGNSLGVLALGNDNILLRGSRLRNTQLVVGICVYTGRDTKLIQNAKKTVSKYSNFEKVVNKLLYVIFTVQLVLVTIADVLACVWLGTAGSEWYLKQPGNATNSDTGYQLPNFIGYWFTFFGLFNNFVPISLYVTLETVSVFHSVFINKDPLMYDEESNIAAACRSTNLCQEIGQVEYVFSDKTGTLTRNEMKFNKCSINGKTYSAGSPELMQDMRDGKLDNFFILLGVCHTVIIAQANAEEKQIPDVSAYQAESPDELALVLGARDTGFIFSRRQQNTVRVSINRGEGDMEVVEYEVLAVNQFSSLRKRMSMVVRTPSGAVELLCKGADNIIRERSLHFESDLIDHLKQFACEGLRTLVMGKRTIPAEEWAKWSAELNEANLALEGRKERLSELAAEIEKGLEIIGASAIEDKLQEDVPRTISDLHAAGIKLWVLTGDKLETAISIGFSANVLNQSMTIHQVKINDPDGDKSAQYQDISDQMQELKARVCDPGDGAPTPSAPASEEKNHAAPEQQSGSTVHALVITGPALSFILSSQVLKEILLNVGIRCSVVLACRVSPAQKALLVQLVQLGVKPRPVTLAIGDGANDVPMIQQAQVGVGISGKEGNQASSSSDFSFAKFMFLRRLLLLHGRWNYRRLAKVILYSFYKNINISMIIFYYTLFSSYSGASMFEDNLYSLFNVTFAGLPIIAIGAFDRDVTASTALSKPKLYDDGRLGKDINFAKIIITVLRAILHSVVIFVFTIFAYRTFENDSDGSVLAFGTAAYSALIIVISVRAGYITHTWFVCWLAGDWTWINWLVIIISVGSLFVISIILSSPLAHLLQPRFYGVASRCYDNPLFWLLIVSTVLTCLMIDVVYDRLRVLIQPRFLDVEQAEDHEKHYLGFGCVRKPCGHETTSPTDTLMEFSSGDNDTGEAGKKSVTPNEVDERPKNSPFFKQTMYGWQPPITSIGIVTLLTVSSLILILLGIAIEVERASLKTIKVTYAGVNNAGTLFYESDSPSDIAQHNCTGKSTAADATWPECTITFQIDQKMRAPIQVYYGVENMYQNNLIYATSVSYPQLQGEEESKKSLSVACAKGYLTNSAGDIYWPCGLIANTMFTDRFEVLTPDVTMSSSSISWPSDVNGLFSNPTAFRPNFTNATIPGYVFVDQAYADTPYADEFDKQGLDNQHLQVWMRPAAFSSFRKLYGIIDQDLAASTSIQFRVVDVFEATKFGGAKSLTISEFSSLSSRESVLGITNIVVGCCFLAFAVAFLIQHCLFPDCAASRLDIER